jgi:hypothetical protein
MKTVKTAKKPAKKTKEINLNKKPVGRPTPYKTEYSKIAKQLAYEGLIDAKIAKALGVSHVTLIEWKKKHSEFLKAINEGKENPNKEVRDALLKRAKGFTFKSEKIVVVSDGQGLGSHIERVPIVEYVIPSESAAKTWLYNRDRENWYDSQNINMNANINDASEMSPEERHNWLIENGFIKK